MHRTLLKGNGRKMQDLSSWTEVEATCPTCGRGFTGRLWLAVDVLARPDLLRRARYGTIHRLRCPHDLLGEVDEPRAVTFFHHEADLKILTSVPDATSPDRSLRRWPRRSAGCVARWATHGPRTGGARHRLPDSVAAKATDPGLPRIAGHLVVLRGRERTVRRRGTGGHLLPGDRRLRRDPRGDQAWAGLVAVGGTSASPSARSTSSTGAKGVIRGVLPTSWWCPRAVTHAWRPF
jgi:hypothetical protein